MTANPLRDVSAPMRGKVTEEMLHDMAFRYNQARWVKDSGKPYFVNRRTRDDGTMLHFLDR